MKTKLPEQSEPAQVDATTPARELATLLASLRELIQRARDQALRAVDQVQVHTCWRVGYHIVEFEQGGAVRAAYGKRLLAELAERLTAEFGKGFDASNLRYMRLFYKAFPNCDALRHELSWTHYRGLLRVENDEAASKTAELAHTPRQFIRDPVMLKFLGLPNVGRLLDFCGHEPVLRVYKNLCRHYWDIDPAATAYYVNAYCEYWDGDEQEGQP